jgi:DNA-binding transcriptional LysR family regulator
VRHRSNDADVQLELVRVGAAVALMPPLTLPAHDPALAIRDLAEGTLKRRLMAVTRDTPPGPALTALLTAVRNQRPEQSTIHTKANPTQKAPDSTS